MDCLAAMADSHAYWRDTRTCSMTSPARMAGAGALLLALVATVCAVLGGGSGVGATGLLQAKSASAAAATSFVFTAQVGRNVELSRAAPLAMRPTRA